MSIAKRLRRKFILVAMAAVSIVLVVIIGGINVVNWMNVVEQADRRLDVIEGNGGVLPDSAVLGPAAASPGGGTTADGEASAGEGGGTPGGASAGRGSGARSAARDGDLSPETLFETRFFTVTLDADGGVVATDTDKIAAVDSDEAAGYARKLTSGGAREGFYGSYRYRAVAGGGSGTGGADGSGSGGDTMYIFLDCTRDLASLRSFLSASVAISAVGWLLVLALVVGLSRAVIRPIAESYDKQRRFITDASHEIKTPLSIIDAADEVVEMEAGESEWTRSIHDQVARLSKLTERLVFLARMDEGAGFSLEDISLTEVVERAAAPYTAVARARDLHLSCDIQPGVRCRGDAAALAQAVELLLDNAMRYASAGSVVELSLKTRGRRRVLAVRNACDTMPAGDLDRLFERFYRADESRSRATGGSGVGLSVVRAVAETHHGTARCRAVDAHTIELSVEL